MRTISVLSAYTKLIERCIHVKMLDVMYGDNGCIPMAQLGFRPGFSCSDQIARLAAISEKIRSLETERRAAKIKPAKADKCYVAFIDIKKAYDTVDRDLLIAKMIKYKFDNQVITAVAKMFDGTSMDLDGGIKTFRGL